MEQLASADPLIGANIGNYTVKSKLGEGGMGCVYLAEHPLIGKRVALKVLHAEYASREDVVKRFFQEAKAVNDIKHPNIVDIVDYGVITNAQGPNTVYFIMELLDGPTLADLIRTDAPLAPERTLTIGLQIADALCACHDAGVVHRDLKPDNILLIRRGREPDFVKVLDFGIAKLTGPNKVSMRTRTGLFMGTPAYMSPEQCEDSAAVDLRTDIYALGILLYEMLTGQVPFTGNSYGHIFLQQLTRVPPPLSTVREEVPPHIEAVVFKALAKQADARFQNMRELMAALVGPGSHGARQDGVSGLSSRDGVSGFLERDDMDRSPSTLVPVVTPSGQVIQVPSNMLSTPVTPPLERPRRSGRVALIATLGALLGLGSAGAWWMNQRQGAAAAGSLPDATHEAPSATEAELRVQAGATGDEAAARDASSHAGRAAAPVMAPVEVTPAAAQEILVRVLSRPDGAAVFLDDETRPRGQTPLELSVPRGTSQARLTLRLDGYRDETRRFVPDDNKEYDLQLRRERRPAHDAHAVDRSSNTENPDRQARTDETNQANQNDDKSDGDKIDGGKIDGDRGDRVAGDRGDKIAGKVVDEDGLEEPPAQ